MPVAFVNSNGGGTTANAGSSTMNVPASIVSGRVLVLGVCCDQNFALSGWPTGWNTVFTAVDNGTSLRLECRYKVADGTETNFALTHSSNMTSHIMAQFSGQHASSAPEGTTVNSSINGTNIDPPSFAPSWGSEQTYWVAIGAYDNGTATFTTDAPSGYTHLDKRNGASAQGTGIGFAGLLATASSQDPGAFVISASQVWIGALVAIRPAAAGADPVEVLGSRRMISVP